jgi:hypothetical protein
MAGGFYGHRGSESYKASFFFFGGLVFNK